MTNFKYLQDYYRIEIPFFFELCLINTSLALKNFKHYNAKILM